MVDADRGLIAEVLDRLLQTALHFATDGAPVEVKTCTRERQALVSVGIPGLEIAAERLPHAFEPFFLLIPAGAPGYTGDISLGLYLSKQIIEANGGQIRLTRQPGQGITVYFSLPLA